MWFVASERGHAPLDSARAQPLTRVMQARTTPSAVSLRSVRDALRRPGFRGVVVHVRGRER